MTADGLRRHSVDVEWLAAVADASADPLIVLDEQGTLQYANPITATTLGVDVAEWVGRDVLTLVHPDDHELALGSLGVMVDTTSGVGNAVDLRVLAGDGSFRSMEMVGANHLDDPAVRGIILTLRDTTKRREAEAGRDRAEQLLEYTFATNPIGLALCTLEGRFVRVNRAMCEMVGLSESTLLADTYQGRTDEREVAAEAEQFAALLSGEVSSYAVEKRVVRADGSVTWGEMTVSLIHGPVSGDLLILGQLRDISEQKALREELAARSLRDPLTGLPNRALFQDRVVQAVAGHRRSNIGFAVLFVDLDDFKAVNDGLGHPAGDHFLRTVAERLEQRFRAVDTVSRIGGDEFAVLIDDLQRSSDAHERCAEVLELVSAAVDIDGHELIVSASVGLTTVLAGDTDDRDCSQLLADADLAMYSAKLAGKRAWRSFEPSMRSAAQDRLELREAMSRGAIEGEVNVYYEPVVEVATGTVVGLEAVIRWRHPLRGVVPRAELHHLAEETGASVEFGRRLFAALAIQRQVWLQAQSPLADLPVGLKVSGSELRDPSLVRRFRELMKAGAFPVGHLTVELAEPAIDADVVHAETTIGELHDLGVSVALDRFGAGRASITYLSRLDVDYLKTERQLLLDMVQHEGNERLLPAVVALCDELGITPVIAGIESAEQVERLSMLGVAFGQGHFFSRAVTAPALEAALGESGVLSVIP